MGVKRFRFLSGAVLTVLATSGVTSSYAGSVSASPDATTVEAPIDFEQPSLTQGFDDPSNLSASETGGNGGAAWTTFEARGDQSELLLLGDVHGAEPAAWSSGFADGSLTSGSSGSRGGSDGYVFAPPPEQVLIPLPSAAWTGLTALAGLGALGMMKHARRFFR